MCHTTSILLSGIGFRFLPSKEAHFCLFYKDFPSFVYDLSHTPCLLSSSRCASRGYAAIEQDNDGLVRGTGDRPGASLLPLGRMQQQRGWNRGKDLFGQAP